LGIHPGVFRIVKLVSYVLLIAHASSCIFLAIPMLEHGEEELDLTWLGNCSHDYTEFSREQKYLLSFYWAMTTLTTVGFGDVVPYTGFERIFTIFAMILGVAFYAYSTATVSSVLHSLDVRETQNREKMESLRAFMNGVGLPSNLIKKLYQHFRYAWWQHTLIDTQSLMER